MPKPAAFSSETANSGALANALLANTYASRLFSIAGFNTGPNQYIQVHDSAAAAAEGAVPKLVLKVFADQQFSFDWTTGRIFNKGVYLCNSTTAATKTIGAADCIIDAEFREL